MLRMRVSRLFDARLLLLYMLHVKATLIIGRLSVAQDGQTYQFHALGLH